MLPPRRPDDIVLAAGLRTPFSKFGGALRQVPSVELGAEALRRLVARTGLAVSDIDEVFYGVTLPSEVALDGPTSGRQALLRAGLPEATRSLTLDRGCCSSMTAVHLAMHSLRRGDSGLVIAAGAENMGRATFLAPAGLRFGHRHGSITLRDPLDRLGADIGGRPVTVDVGEVALAWGVSREMQDDWAEASHRRYFEAKAAGFYADHLAPVDLPTWKALLDHDEMPRADCSRAKLATLPTVYDSATITAGNSPGLDTGAAALLLTTRAHAAERGLEPLATLVGQGSAAGPARDIAVIPGPSIVNALRAPGWSLADLDAIEVNEAFAAVPLVTARWLAGRDAEIERGLLAKMNLRGGAVAIGHPTGASGARLVLQLALHLRARGGGRGVASICGALGQADAVSLVVD